MPTRNISLTAEQDDFVEKVVKDGEYQNSIKLNMLRLQIKAGVEALERGEFAEVDEVD